MLRTRDNIFDQVQNPRKTILTSQNTKELIQTSVEPQKNNSEMLRTRDNIFDQVQNPRKTILTS